MVVRFPIVTFYTEDPLKQWLSIKVVLGAYTSLTAVFSKDPFPIDVQFKSLNLTLPVKVLVCSCPPTVSVYSTVSL